MNQNNLYDCYQNPCLPSCCGCDFEEPMGEQGPMGPRVRKAIRVVKDPKEMWNRRVRQGL